MTRSPQSRVGHASRRHPLCPQCSYDLVATVDANKRTCPECGYTFTMSELMRAPEKDDWTPAAGLKRAVIALLVRALILLPIWAAWLWLMAPIINMFPAGRIGSMIGVTLIIALPALAIGFILSMKMNEISGMESIIVSGACLLTALLIMIGGAEIAQFMRTTLAWKGFIESTATVLAAILIIRNVHFET